jgi:hypothetical protein
MPRFLRRPPVHANKRSMLAIFSAVKNSTAIKIIIYFYNTPVACDTIMPKTCVANISNQHGRHSELDKKMVRLALHNLHAELMEVV